MSQARARVCRDIVQANAPSTLGSFDSVRKSCSCSCTLGGGTQALGEFAAPLESVRLSVLPLASFLALLPPPYLPLRPPHPPRASVLLVLVLVLVLVLLLLLLLLLVLFLLSSLPPPPLLPPPPPPPPPPPLFSSFSRSSTVDDFPFPSRRSRRAHANRPLASHMHARDSTLAFSPSGRFSIVRVSRLLLLSLSLSFFLSFLTSCTSWLHRERDTTRSLGIATCASGTLDSSMGPQDRNASRYSRFSFLSVDVFLFSTKVSKFKSIFVRKSIHEENLSLVVVHG